jgi:hypothetical protein
MSEFSESYHLLSSNPNDATVLLEELGLAGYVYPECNGWTTFLVEGGSFVPDVRIVGAARHLLLHFVSAEDHGWSFSLFDSGQIISAYQCRWNDAIEFDDSNYSRTVIEERIQVHKSEGLDDFEQHFRSTYIDEVLDAEPSKIFAQAIGLEHYDWLSFDYVSRDLLETPGNYPEVIRIN